MPIAREDVIRAYRVLLGRSPENDQAIVAHLRIASNEAELARNISRSEESRLYLRDVEDVEHEHHIFRGYDEKDKKILEQFQPDRRPGRAGFITSFLGSRYRTSFVTALPQFDGAVETYPLPAGSLQGETAEFVGVLRSVLDARGGKYRMLECGAGYGTWMVNSYMAARQRGIDDIHVYGVEGDAGHFAFLQQHMSDNQIPEGRFTAFNAAIGPERGSAEWPLAENAADVYGGRPLDDGADYHGRRPQRTVTVPVLALRELRPPAHVGAVLQIDILGGEGELCETCIDAVTARVRRVFVGTHSRALDGQVMATFHRAGWSLENEKPTILKWHDGSPTLENLATVDGLQVWRNRHFDNTLSATGVE